MVLAGEKGVAYPRSVSVETVFAYYTYLVTPPTEYVVASTYDGTVVRLEGRGLAFPTIHQALWAIAKTHLSLNLSDPTKARCITGPMAELKKEHVQRGAIAFDIVEVRAAVATGLLSAVSNAPATRRRARPQGMKELRAAVFTDEYQGRKNPLTTGLWRLQMWTMMMLQLSMVGRSSLMTTYCPHVEQLELPGKDTGYSVDGWPEYVLLHLKQWKGNAAGTRQQARTGCAARPGDAAARWRRGGGAANSEI